MIIDCHCHAGKGDANTAPWNSDAKLEPFLTWSRNAGIQKTVVFPVFTQNSQRANRELAALVKRYHGRLIPFAWINPKRDRGRIKELIGEAVGRFGFRGIKVHGSQALPNREVCDAIRPWRVPLLVDVFGHPESIEMLAPQYPEIDFIVPHFGSFADDYKAQQRVVDQIVKFPNVYADTSGLRRFEYLQEGVRRASSAKVLFGTDGPWLHPAVEIAKIHALKLPPAQARQVLGGNLIRLLSKRNTTS